MKSTLPSAGEDADLLDDDEMGSDLDGDQSSLGSRADDEIELAEGSDDEDLISQGDNGLIEYDGSSANELDTEAEWGGVDDAGGEKKRKRKEDNDRRRSARKKLKSLPTFASYEDYAAMIEVDGEDSGS
jgi:ribosome biogenesis protein MAK21